MLSRRAKIDLDQLRELVSAERAAYDADVELEAWTVPRITQTTNGGPRCPTCDGELTFERFDRIRPPPLRERRQVKIPRQHPPQPSVS